MQVMEGVMEFFKTKLWMTTFQVQQMI
jgi:hypothetical protein